MFLFESRRKSIPSKTCRRYKRNNPDQSKPKCNSFESN